MSLDRLKRQVSAHGDSAGNAQLWDSLNRAKKAALQDDLKAMRGKVIAHKDWDAMKDGSKTKFFDGINGRDVDCH